MCYLMHLHWYHHLCLSLLGKCPNTKCMQGTYNTLNCRVTYHHPHLQMLILRKASHGVKLHYEQFAAPLDGWVRVTTFYQVGV